MSNLYSYTAIDSLISTLENDYGYECCQIFEGTLGSGNWICVPPDDNHYYYIVSEVYLNEWSSAHKVRKCSKLSKANEKLLVEYYAYGTR